MPCSSSQIPSRLLVATQASIIPIRHYLAIIPNLNPPTFPFINTSSNLGSRSAYLFPNFLGINPFAFWKKTTSPVSETH